MPCTDLLATFFLLFGVKLGNKIGLRYTILISLFFIYSSCLLLIYSPNYYIVLIAMCLLGVGNGLSYFFPIKNCWKYFPRNNGLIFGICVGGLGLSSSILTPLADFIINDGETENETNSEGYYPEDISNNLQKFLQVLLFIYIFLGIIAFCFAFQYDGEDENDEDILNSEKEYKDISIKELCKLFCTKRNMYLLSFCVCGLCK